MNFKASIFLGICLALFGYNGWAADCTSAGSQCTEWVTLKQGGGRTLVYRTHSLVTPNADITQAVVVVHGGGRGADRSFQTMNAVVTAAGKTGSTLIIAPHFAANNGTCEDKLARKELNFPCGSWQAGAIALDQKQATAFDVLDDIVQQLGQKSRFPNLHSILIAGHSAGGQFVTRYAMANQVQESVPEVAIRYVVANPSTSMYLDDIRPVSIVLPENVAAENSGAATVTFGSYPGADRCKVFNLWPYGLEKRAGYSARVEDEALRRQLASRPVTYLLGELDVLPRAGFDETCSGMAQGQNRLMRGLAYVQYVNEKIGGSDSAVVIPVCGHDERCMFSSARAVPVLFPE